MRILYATDGSTPAREGERLITALFARAHSVHAFSVAVEPRYDWLGPEPNLELARMDLPVLSADQVAAEAADRLADEGFDVSTRGSRGHPGTEILREAEDEDVDLIVLGASHTTWMGNLLMGSVSTYVLHHADRSALVTHRAPAGTGEVLVGADGSDHSLAALRLAAEVLDRDRCTLHLTTVVTEPLASVVFYAPGIPLDPHAAYDDQHKRQIEHGWSILKRARSLLALEGFEAEEALLVGRPAHQLLKEIDNVPADLVVVGSRGLGPVRRSLLGSVSDQLVRHAPATLVGRKS